MSQLTDIQDILLVEEAYWGPISQAALDLLTHGGYKEGVVTLIGDIDRTKAYNYCIRQGGSVAACSKNGESGKGRWGDLLAQTTTAMCALPPDELEYRWGSIDAAKHKQLEVTVDGNAVICIVADVLPHKGENEGVMVSINPAAAATIALTGSFRSPGFWVWVD